MPTRGVTYCRARAAQFARELTHRVVAHVKPPACACVTAVLFLKRCCPSLSHWRPPWQLFPASFVDQQNDDYQSVEGLTIVSCWLSYVKDSHHVLVGWQPRRRGHTNGQEDDGPSVKDYLSNLLRSKRSVALRFSNRTKPFLNQRNK